MLNEHSATDLYFTLMIHYKWINEKIYTLFRTILTFWYLFKSLCMILLIFNNLHLIKWRNYFILIHQCTSLMPTSYQTLSLIPRIEIERGIRNLFKTRDLIHWAYLLLINEKFEMSSQISKILYSIPPSQVSMNNKMEMSFILNRQRLNLMSDYVLI